MTCTETEHLNVCHFQRLNGNFPFKGKTAHAFITAKYFTRSKIPLTYLLYFKSLTCGVIAPKMLLILENKTREKKMVPKCQSYFF